MSICRPGVRLRACIVVCTPSVGESKPPSVAAILTGRPPAPGVEGTHVLADVGDVCFVRRGTSGVCPWVDGYHAVGVEVLVDARGRDRCGISYVRPTLVGY